MTKQVQALAYMFSQPQVAMPETEARVTPDARALQKRWPMALSIWAAVAVSVGLWAGIAWIVSMFLGAFS